MGLNNISVKKRRWKQLSEIERHKIESFLKAGWSIARISLELGRDRRTISREIDRGKVTERNSDWSEGTIYRGYHGQLKHDEYASNKGKAMLGLSKELYRYILNKFRNKYSPDAIIGELRRDGSKIICTKTLYNYICAGYFKELEIAPKRKRQKRREVSWRNVTAKRITERPIGANLREAGHWEMDTVVGGKACLLVLTERHSRYELIFKLTSRTQLEVTKVLDRLEKQYKNKFNEIFKSITCDNGGEFLHSEVLERSIYKGKRIDIYYARPYSSWERGSNENANKLIRKWIKKGEDISNLPVAYIKRVQNWINNYPRKIFNYKTAATIWSAA